jgi:hypothetical protein
LRAGSRPRAREKGTSLNGTDKASPWKRNKPLSGYRRLTLVIFPRGRCVSLYTPQYLFEPSVRDQLRSGSFWATAYSLNLLRNSASGFQFSDGTIVAQSASEHQSAIALRRHCGWVSFANSIFFSLSRLVGSVSAFNLIS